MLNENRRAPKNRHKDRSNITIVLILNGGMPKTVPVINGEMK